jgi:hypothetical protein
METELWNDLLFLFEVAGRCARLYFMSLQVDTAGRVVVGFQTHWLYFNVLGSHITQAKWQSAALFNKTKLKIHDSDSKEIATI